MILVLGQRSILVFAPPALQQHFEWDSKHILSDFNKNILLTQFYLNVFIIAVLCYLVSNYWTKKIKNLKTDSKRVLQLLAFYASAAGSAGSTRAGHPKRLKPEESGFTLRTQTSSHRPTVRLCPRQLPPSEQTTPSPAGYSSLCMDYVSR